MKVNTHYIFRKNISILKNKMAMIQFFFILYVLLAKGTPHRNDYGDIRPSAAWEKLLAWIMIIFSLITIFAMFIFSYYFASPDFWDTPSQILQNTTEYF